MSAGPPIKILVFAHVPPPHHGQSYMVQLMLEGFGGDHRKHARRHQPNSFGIECYHVNARVSKKLEDIGDFRLGKFLLLLWYCVQAIWCRFRYGVDNLYYVPAPGKRSALYRDWMVMALCRPFFKRVILHWHAAGLGKWLETAVRIRSRATTYNLMKNADLSIVLSRYNQADAEKLLPQRIRIVSNGIPDPCPNFEREILPIRRERAEARRRLLSGEPAGHEVTLNASSDHEVFRVLYIAHCIRNKGLFDAIEGVRLAAKQLRERRSPLSLHFTIAGNFVTPEERQEFDTLIGDADCVGLIHYAGFVSGEQKNQLLRASDLFCFPTFYQNENQPVNLIEAMAFGLPIVTTRWRSLPEMFPEGYPGLVEVHAPNQVGKAILQLAGADNAEDMRNMFLREFTSQKYLSNLSAALRCIYSRSEMQFPQCHLVTHEVFHNHT
jgi:glycosyltransferase involved in cell wall biosynthesis